MRRLNDSSPRRRWPALLCLALATAGAAAFAPLSAAASEAAERPRPAAFEPVSSSSASEAFASPAAAKAPSPPPVFLYSETDYLSLTDDVVTQNQLRVSLWRPFEGFKAYAGLAFEQDLRSDATVIYNDNNVSPLVGASYTLPFFPLTAFAEYRAAFRLIQRPLSRPDEQTDIHAGAFLYHWVDVARIRRGLGAFNETYAEAVFASRLDNDVFTQGWNKLGVRWSLGRGWSADALVEGVFRRDRLGDPGDNLEAISPGARLTAAFAPLYASIFAKRSFGTYDGSYADGKYAESSAQLVLTGEF